MATKSIKPLTPAEIQRALEKKYGVIPSPWWLDICALTCNIDGEPAPTGTELILKCSSTGIVCGAAVFFQPGMMRFSPAYGNDTYETRKSGKITGLQLGDRLLICNAKTGMEYDYHPAIIWRGYYTRVFINELSSQ
jgi:hypothetical protein